MTSRSLGTPGTVTPVPDLGAAAFFAPADPQTLPRGDAIVTLRRRDAAPVDVGARPVPLGLWVAFTQLRPAAYVVVRNDRGERLTITQPNNPSFLSPVILFRQAQQIHDAHVPARYVRGAGARSASCTCSISARPISRRFRTIRPRRCRPSPARSSPSPTTPAPSKASRWPRPGREAAIGGLHVTVTLGTYPVLQLASAPQPFVMPASSSFCSPVPGRCSGQTRPTVSIVIPSGAP